MSDTESSGTTTGASWYTPTPAAQTSSNGFDASAYGGKEAGFDSNYDPSTGGYVGNTGSSSFDLSSMYHPFMDTWSKFKSEFTTPGEIAQGLSTVDPTNIGTQFTQEDPYKGATGWFQPGSAGYKWGLRDPGSVEAQNGAAGETSAERDVRMGKVNGVVDSIAGMFPGMGMAKGVANAYNGYQQGQPFSTLAGNFLGGMGGVPGAVGSALQGNYGTALAKSVPGIGGAMAGLGVDAAMGLDVTNPAATLAAGYVGNQLGGPLAGALAGSMAKASFAPDQPQQQGQPNGMMKTGFNVGQYIPGYTSAQQATQQQTPQKLQQPQFGFGDIATGLAGLYSANQNSNHVNSMMDQMKQQQAAMPSLDSMYGPNSPYALEMRKRLAAQDAKSGRNSQYGPREAQLQALLADKATTYGGQLATQNQGYAKSMADLQAQQDAQRNGQLNILAGLGSKSGLFDKIGGGLMSMFRSGPSQEDQQVFNTTQYT